MEFAPCPSLSPLCAALKMRFAKNKEHDTSKVLRLPRKITLEVSKVLRLPRKMQRIFWKRHKSIAPATRQHFRHALKHVGMWQSATPATRNEATRRWKPPKVTHFAELTISFHRHGHSALARTVADGWATSGEHSSTPRPPEWNGNPCCAFGKNPQHAQVWVGYG